MAGGFLCRIPKITRRLVGAVPAVPQPLDGLGAGFPASLTGGSAGGKPPTVLVHVMVLRRPAPDAVRSGDPPTRSQDSPAPSGPIPVPVGQDAGFWPRYSRISE